MRLLIDIPEEVYNVCKGWQELNRSTRLENIVANGIPYEERKEENQMHTYYDAKEMLHKELEDIVKKGELSAGSLETIDKLLNSIKNACKIIMYEEYSEDEGYSNADGSMGNMGNYSNARGRGTNARRDSMGRYSRNGYSMRGGRGGYSRDGRYSYDDGEGKMEILQDMMNEARSEDERRVIQKVMRRMEE